jgi:hypothetical protein
LRAHKRKLYHLGIKQNVNQSTLSRANEKRDWRIFAEFGDYLIKFVRPLYAGYSVANLDLYNEIFALDSTTISLSIKLFSWAPGKYSRGAVKVHTLLDLRGSIPSFILITDGKYHDSNMLDVILPIPNSIYLMDKAYLDFVALYRIHKAEAFFVTRPRTTFSYNTIKQNLTIKKLWGHSENAVKIHIWVAICTYLIIAYIKNALKSQLSIYEIMQILGISAFDKTSIRELLTEFQVNQDVKEQLDLFI